MKTLLPLPPSVDASSPPAPRRPFGAAELRAAGERSDAIELVDPSDPLIVRYPDDRGFNRALREIDARLASRPSGPAALGWPAWTDAVALGADPAALDVEQDVPSETDRDAWAAISGAEHDRRQARLAAYYRDGRVLALGGCVLAVSLCVQDEELADAFTQGWLRGEAELEVELAEAARDRLPWDERADESATLDRLERGVVLA